MVFLEDLRKEVTGADKILAPHLTRASRRCRSCAASLRRRGATRKATLATIIFSSGSTGVPKGVMLTHANVLANVDSLAQIFPMAQRRVHRRPAVLPFVRLHRHVLVPAARGRRRSSIHPNPMDAKTIGELAETYKATMLISTPTFCSVVRAPVHEGTVRAPQVRDRRRREAARAAARPSSRRSTASICSRATAAPRWRRSSPSTARTSSSAPKRRSATSPARWAIPFQASPRRSSIRRPAKISASARRACCSSRART